MTTVHTAMKENGRKALRGLAVTLSLIVYLAGLLYAGVRSFDLFSRTIPADLLPLAVIGIVALELTALGLPVAIHFWTSPGAQRMAALGFYAVDLAFIVGNSILDAAQNSGAILPGFMAAYGVFIVPALPVACMVGWALVWMLDPTSREHDMTAAVKAATHEAMLSQIIEEAKAVDIADDVRAAAAQRARAIVSETLGKARRQSVPARPVVSYNADSETIPEVAERESVPVRARKNGASPKG
jgi:hypothetical protein